MNEKLLRIISIEWRYELETTEEKEVELVTIGEILEFAWTK
jgi:hypothetical protein